MEQLLDRTLSLLAQLLGGGVTREETIRALILLVVAVLSTIVSIYWRRILMRVGLIRRKIDAREFLCGDFIQPLYSNDAGLRYTLIEISYGGRSEYRVKGISYKPDGTQFASFESRYVFFPSPYSIEIIWTGREQYEPITLGGFARIEFHEIRSKHPVSGDGYSIDFTRSARVNKLRIERINTPIEDAGAFIASYHANNGERVQKELASTASIEW